MLDLEADTRAEPVTDDEAIWVTLLLLHINASHSAIKADIISEPEGLTLDLKGLFALPIPRAAWERRRPLQDREFAAFLDERLSR